MNDIFKETFGTPNIEKLTPIEIALGVDVQGMTTARKLYKFLDKDISHYSRWFKKNIVENEFAEEGSDYFPFTINGECGGQASMDARLTANFAKKLSMMQKSEKGEAARNYFVGIENGAKKLIRKATITEHPGEVANYLKVIDRRMEKEGIAPYKIAQVLKMISEQYGIQLPEYFVKVPEYEQVRLDLM